MKTMAEILADHDALVEHVLERARAFKKDDELKLSDDEALIYAAFNLCADLSEFGYGRQPILDVQLAYLHASAAVHLRDVLRT